MAEEEVDPVDPVEPTETGSTPTAKLPTTPPVTPPAPPVPPAVDKSQYVVVADDAAVAASRGTRKPRPAKGRLKPDSLSADYIVVAGDQADSSDKKAQHVADVPTATGATPTAVAPTVATPAAATNTAATPTVLTPTVVTPTAAPTTATEIIDGQQVAPAAAAAGSADAPRVVYVEAPKPPKPHGNRAFGVLIALGASVIFAVLFAFAVLLILRSIRGFATMTMLANYGYWIPVGVFVVAMLIAVLIINRGGWWTYIIGSAIIAVLVYAGATALITIVSLYVVQGAPSTGFVEALASPTAIAAGIIAREVALWSGVIISRRGKSVRLRNAEERAAFDREQAANAH